MVIRGALVAALLVSASACSPAGAAADIATRMCEAKLLSSITTPATYKMVSARISGPTVAIEFDAQNTSGATTRDSFRCDFRQDPGGIYFSDDAYWDWKSCDVTGKPEHAGVDCGAAAADSMLLDIDMEKVGKYPIDSKSSALVVPLP